MDTTMETISFELPKADLKLFKELAKKMGWTITDKKSGIEKAMAVSYTHLTLPTKLEV